MEVFAPVLLNRRGEEEVFDSIIFFLQIASRVMLLFCFIQLHSLVLTKTPIAQVGHHIVEMMHMLMLTVSLLVILHVQVFLCFSLYK